MITSSSTSGAAFPWIKRNKKYSMIGSKDSNKNTGKLDVLNYDHFKSYINNKYVDLFLGFLSFFYGKISLFHIYNYYSI